MIEKTEISSVLRDQAETARARAEESFQRCDTDGVYTQIAHRLEASRLRLAADLVDHDGLDVFVGLYEVATGRRVVARIVTGDFGEQWELHSSETVLTAKRGKRWLPSGWNSRVLRSIGLVQSRELAPGVARISAPEGTRGFAGFEVTRAVIERAGDPWGTDSVRLTWVATY